MRKLEAVHEYCGRAKAAAAALAIYLLLLPAQAACHGVKLSCETIKGIAITAQYDSGEPMAGGQVTVYSPDDPLNPWLTGTCDESGKFFFTPDPDCPGLWEVQVRLAGHGALARIEVTSDGIVAVGASGLTTLQKLVMALAVVWGLAGTALFFSRRKK
jgi:nickel transport protein